MVSSLCQHLHFLDAEGHIAPYRESIHEVAQQALTRIAEFVDCGPIDILVQRLPEWTIPELGIGGFSPRANLTLICIDPQNSNLEQSLVKELPDTLAHELHHCLRWRSVGYGTTLDQAIISEGLADHFAIEVFGGERKPWDHALSEAKVDRFLDLAKREFGQDGYDHQKWFFGTAPEQVARWAGYSLGFHLVGAYLSENPTRRPSNLHDVGASDILASSGY